jgi:stress-induced morphogen
MPTPEELKRRIEQALPGALAEVEDLTGGGDHFRAEVVSDRLQGLSRFDQH